MIGSTDPASASSLRMRKAPGNCLLPQSAVGAANIGAAETPRQ